ncbi:MAG TPA: cytochrome c-type biogenesis CcmF C-terminal domain-containing protein [Gaiellaceae bacterium]|jgi:cytochrome c-type biogenesis protein CcmF|nr:cytochrome c-type biogenesis CcmF C-terminal domain-containing protein [Gaiellaceae bacterium]
MPELGRAALVVTLGLSTYALVAGAAAAHLGRRRLAHSAQNALIAAFLTTLVASLILLAALLRHDFSFAYVARTTSEALPTAYTVSAFWGGQEGSLLLWLLVLTAFGAAAVRLNRTWARDLIVWVVPVFAAVAVFFSFLVVAVASPFATQAPPPDGAGMTPSLQNPYMLAHPPLLYLGYVGLTVPFAFALGALLSGRLDERWLVATRRWTLLAWAALGIGQLLGAHWAYVEVGWGGYYAWDPVENAALMPWLAATAFLHSVMIQEKRGMLRVWNVLLVILAFTLSLFGTFLTRSGVVNSIHSFTQSSIGPWFLGFIGVTVAVSLGLVFWRLPQLRSPTKLESPISREAAFLYNNLLLLALCLAILWGVVYPMLSEALRGEAVVLGRSYYDFFLRVFGLPLLLLMGIGPLVAWRRASLRSLVTTFRWPTLVALATGILLLVLGAGRSTPGLVAYTFSAFVGATIVMEFARGTRARKALGATSWPGAFASLMSRNRRRYGGYVVHASIVLLAIGIAGSSAFDSVAESKLTRGESLEIGGYTLVYRSLAERQTANATEIRATLDVTRGDSDLGTLEAGKNAYTIEQQVSNEVGIRSDRLTGEDLFVIAEQIDPDGSVYFRVFVKPLVNLIWLAGLVFLLGSAITLWPDRREQRRLVARAEAVGLPATR